MTLTRDLLPSFKIIDPLVLKRVFFKVFGIYSHGGHLGHVTLTILYTLSFPLADKKFGFDWPSSFREEDF